MLIWKRHIPKNVRSLVAIGTLSAIVALALVRPYSTTFGQEPRPGKEQTKEPKAPPVKGSEEKEQIKKSDERGPVKDTKEKEPIKKSEEQQQEGRGEKTEKAPQKKDEKAPAKGNEKVPTRGEEKNPAKGNEKLPIRGEEKGTEAAANVKDNTLEGQLVKITGNTLMMTSKGGKQHSFRLMEDARLTLDGKALRVTDLKPGMIIRVTTLPPDHGRASRIEVLDQNAVPAGNTRVPKEDTPLPRKVMPKEGDKVVIDGLPEDFEDQQRQAYRRVEHQDLSFEEYLRFAKLEFGRMRELKMNPDLRYRPGQRGKSTANTPCGDGDFELLFDPNDPSHDDDVNSAEWSGGYGIVLPTGVPDYGNFTTGLLPGLINNSNAHQTIVGPGTDPNVPIQMTGPNTFIGPYNTNPISPNAVRIGNAVNGTGAELLSKTFTVTPSNTLIRFWYAVVLENPLGIPPFSPHALNQQPAFQVRILDNSTSSPTEVLGVADLGNGTSKLVADTINNPFFKVQNRPAQPNVPIAYTDWQCAQINLSTLVGKSVTVEFVTQDCTQGGHWGYAYVDDFCGTCDGNPGGDIAFDPDMSTQCGKGQVCFKYTLPTAQNAAGNVTGTAVITLDILQNGVLLQTLSSPTLSSLTNYCFPMDPATIPGLDPLLGFDLVANGIFTLNGYNLPLSVGTAPDGRIPGQNNDYNDPRICTNAPPKPVACGCCPGENLVKNGDFEQGGEIHSEYELASELATLFPGTYSVGDVHKIGKACSHWMLPKACDGTKNFYENVLIVNGQTNQPAGSTAVIWSQQISLPSDAGLKGADYRLCFRYLPLPQCCFDIQAKPTVLVDGKIPLTDVCDEDTGCGHLFAGTFHGGGTINLQIVLPEDGKGDGNDLLIDNISMVRIQKVPFAVVDFTLFAGALNGVTKDVTLTATSPALTSPYDWVWEMWAPGATSPTTTIVGGNTVTFTGLGQSTTDYIFKLKAKSECEQLGGSLQGWHFQTSSTFKAKAGKTIPDPNPEPVDFNALRSTKNQKGPQPTGKRSK